MNPTIIMRTSQGNTTRRTSIALLLGALAIAGHATTWTVSNNPNVPAQHSTVTAAMSAATAGDTILVTGSSTNYGSFNLSKPLTLIGAGHNNGGLATTITNLGFNPGSNNSVLIGFQASTIYVNNGAASSGIRIERCRAATLSSFSGHTTSNFILRNCVFTGNITIPSGSNNIQITNNIVMGVLVGSFSTNMVVSHNLFVNTTTGLAIQNMNGAVFSDNIFWGRTPVDASVNNCSFNNNITYQTTNDVIPFGSNTGANNQTGVNPLFVNAPNRSGSLTYDYNLQSGSPGENAATDGTDIGIFGGGFAFIDLSGRARIPLVTSMTVLNSSVPQGSTLDVQITGTKVD